MKQRWTMVLWCCGLMLVLTACGAPAAEPSAVPTTAPTQTAQPSESPSSPSPSPVQPSKVPVIDVSNTTQVTASPAPESAGASAALEGTWPENEFTDQLPRLAAGKISMSLTQDRSFELLASDLTIEEAKAYIDATIEKGFDQAADLKDYTESGIEAYTYAAQNQQAYSLNISYSVGLLSISIEK